MNMSEYHKRTAFPKELQAVADLFQSIGHPARLAILWELERQNICLTGDLVTQLPLAQSTISRHLKVLKEAGLVAGTIEGERRCYCLSPKAKELLAFITNHVTEMLQDPTSTCC